jgi:hypothetical protein
MKRITSAENLHPMKVTPMSFTRGDVVKKIYSDSITTPYTGVVTAVIPATNKVEVQWPQGMGLEDPWDLIKVNPIINPPTVREDKTYKTYQNQKAQKYNQDYSKDLCHHNVLNDFVSEHVMPVFMMSANLYNEGFSKREAFEKLNSESDNKHIVMYALDKVYTDRVAQEHYTVFNDEGNAKEASLVFSGNSDDGFNITYKYGSSSESYSSDNYQDSFETYNKFLNVLASLENTSSYEDVVSKVASQIREPKKETVKVGSAREHIDNMKLSDLDIMLDKLHKSLQEE